MDGVKNVVEHLNPGKTPVITFDQPLFALAKQIQCKWPENYEVQEGLCKGLQVQEGYT